MFAWKIRSIVRAVGCGDSKGTLLSSSGEDGSIVDVIATLVEDEEGSMDASLLEPHERTPKIRRLVGLAGLALSRSCRRLNLPFCHWISLGRVASLLHPNRAGHARVELTIVQANERDRL